MKRLEQIWWNLGWINSFVYTETMVLTDELIAAEHGSFSETMGSCISYPKNSGITSSLRETK